MIPPSSNPLPVDIDSSLAAASEDVLVSARAGEDRARSRRLLMVAVCVAAVALLGLLSPMPRAWHNRLGTSIADLMHVPAFAILTSLALAVVNHFVSRRWVVHLLVTASVVAAGAAVEVAQSWLGRSASLHDLLANTAGATAALLFRFSLGCNTIFQRFCRLAAINLLLVGLAGPVLSISDVLQQRREKTSLGTFATRTELQRWFAHHASVQRLDNPFKEDQYSNGVRRSPHAAKVTLYPGDYPMFQLQHLTSNWSQYRGVRFNIGRPKQGESSPDSDAPLNIRLRIRDWAKVGTESDSYYQQLTLLPGEQHEFTWEMDELRKQSAAGTLNLDNIRFVEFLAVDMKEPSVFVLADLQLLP